MRNIRNEGFMLIETLIVSVFVGVTLIIMFVQLQNIVSSYKRSFSYNTTKALYNTEEYREFLLSKDINGFVNDLNANTNGYIDITNCANAHYKLSKDTQQAALDYCKFVHSTLDIKKVLLTKQNLSAIKNNISKNAKQDQISQKLVDFVDYIKYDNDNTSVRLIVEYKTDEFASIKIKR